ncbi:MAG: DUF5688 family protein [Lachnospiraceae bacterium]|nr:DUF5688 family protein [Lachnospiraceae bacterium]
MEYKEFLDSVRDYINEKSDEVTVSVHTTLKNNGVRLSGLTFSREGYNASPTIYMENYYSDYENGEDIGEIGDRLLAMYRENDLAVKMDMSFFEDYEAVKERLYLKLINRIKNSDFLKEAPYEEFLDLALVAYVRVCDRRIGNGLIMVRNEHLKMWGKDGSEVIAAAKKNTHDHEKFTLKHILDVLGTAGCGLEIPDGCEDDLPMYVATNSKMTNGAAVLAMGDKLREFSKVLGGDYYIIPSSVHELILLKRTDEGMERIDSMIREVNATQLGPDDVLSDHAYLYSGDDEVLIF